MKIIIRELHRSARKKISKREHHSSPTLSDRIRGQYASPSKFNSRNFHVGFLTLLLLLGPSSVVTYVGSWPSTSPSSDSFNMGSISWVRPCPQGHKRDKGAITHHNVLKSKAQHLSIKLEHVTSIGYPPVPSVCLLRPLAKTEVIQEELSKVKEGWRHGSPLHIS